MHDHFKRAGFGVVVVAADRGVGARAVVAGQRPAEVERAVAVVGVVAGRAAVVGVGLQDLNGLAGGETGGLREDHSDCSGDDRGAG